MLLDGFKAGIVVFDAQCVTTSATRVQPKQFPIGIEYMIVNGKVVVDNNQYGYAGWGGSAAWPCDDMEKECLMTSVSTPTVALETLADLLEHLGGIAPYRVRFRPAPGTATEEDVLALRNSAERRLCELVDGVLVEKAMGLRESLLACALIAILRGFVRPRNLGLVTGEAGMMRLMAGLVRIPDVAFISWDRLPNRRVPTEPIPDLAPNLVVEVLSVGNTPGEMARKRQEYFNSGVQVVWQVDPRMRIVEVFTGPDQSTILHEAQTLDGGVILPGFTLRLQELFAELDLQGES